MKTKRSKMVDGLAETMIRYTFAPHELPLDERIRDRYRDLAVLALDTAKVRIDRLTDAIWEYGEHRKSCRISGRKECDCGFFEIIKSLED